MEYEIKYWETLKLWIEKRQEVVLRLEELKMTFGDIKKVKDRAGLIELERAKLDILKVYLSIPKMVYAPTQFLEDKEEISEKLTELGILTAKVYDCEKCRADKKMCKRCKLK